jgi:response regulator NasT
MRVWLVDDKNESDPNHLETLLKQLADRCGNELTLLGSSPYRPDFTAAMRSLLPDLIVINERAWPGGGLPPEVLGLPTALVVMTAADRAPRFLAQAEAHAVWFVPPGVGLDGLWLALVGAFASYRREVRLVKQVATLEKRLSDRIIIERAKGILVQRLGISEEDAYKRLRVLSRRQRRQMRDIAQSLVDTQSLFLPETNGFVEPVHEAGRSELDELSQ